MKRFVKYIIALLVLLMLPLAPVNAAPAKSSASTSMTQKDKKKAAAAKKKQKAQEKKAKEKAKAAKKKQKEADKKAAAKEKATEQKAKEAEKKEADKQKATAQKEKEAVKKEADKQKAAEDKAKAAEKAAVAKQKAEEKKNQPKVNNYHFLSMWGGAGYSGWVSQMDPVTYDINSKANGAPAVNGTADPKFIGSGGGLIGLGYEFHRKNFMFSVGPEFRFIGSSDKINFLYDGDFQYSFGDNQTQYGSEGMIKRYRFDNLRESQAIGQVTLPIMFGGNFDKYYFLAGAKVGYTLFDFWKHRGNLTTSVFDPMAEDPNWVNVPSHDLISTHTDLTKHPSYDGTAKGQNKGVFGLDAVVSAEFGINLNQFLSAEWNEVNEDSKHPWRMRLGAFIDYGLPIQKAAGEKGAFAYHNGETINTTSLMQTKAFANDTKFSSLLVGIKFTALFQLNKPKVPNPRMQFLVTNYFLADKPQKEAAVGGAKLAITQEGRKRPQVKQVKGDGYLQQRSPKAQYTIKPFMANGYIDSLYYYEGELHTNEALVYEHKADMVETRDTIHFQLIPTPKLYCFVHDATTEQLINASIEFTSRQTGETRTISATTDSKMIFASLRYGDTYDIHVKSPNYHDTTAVITNLYDTVNYFLRPVVRIRRTLLLKRMYFATDKTEILEQSEEDLMILYNFLTENPKIRILITGHTDSQGTDLYNLRLSQGRSESVKAEMVKRGIDADRIETDGKGESEPIDTNDTEEGRQNNRRVQITVLNAEDAIEDVY